MNLEKWPRINMRGKGVTKVRIYHMGIFNVADLLCGFVWLLIKLTSSNQNYCTYLISFIHKLTPSIILYTSQHIHNVLPTHWSLKYLQLLMQNYNILSFLVVSQMSPSTNKLLKEGSRSASLADWYLSRRFFNERKSLSSFEVRS